MKKMKRAKYFAAMLMLIMVVFMMTACDTKEPVLKGIGKSRGSVRNRIQS